MNDNHNLLWTGESVFCRCGHHVEYHQTKTPLYTLTKLSNDRVYCCNFVKAEKICSCGGFEPYKEVLK